jgi:hypothetical protein
MNCPICGAGRCVCGGPARHRYEPAGLNLLPPEEPRPMAAHKDTHAHKPAAHPKGDVDADADADAAEGAEGTKTTKVTGAFKPTGQFDTAGGFTAQARLYLNSKGEVVGEDDPDKQSLLVAEGATLDAATAQKHGLKDEGDDDEGRPRRRK